MSMKSTPGAVWKITLLSWQKRRGTKFSIDFENILITVSDHDSRRPEIVLIGCAVAGNYLS